MPVGAVVKDANKIIPESKIFKVRDGYSTFSDFFRWKVVLENGGWWVDTDAVCLKPFDFDVEYVFTGGLGAPGTDECVSSGVFKAPKGSPIMQWGWDECQKMDPATMAWGEPGPPLITKAVHRFGLQSSIIPAKQFFPIFWTESPRAFIEPNGSLGFPSNTYSVHFFNELWRSTGRDKNAVYPPTSIYEQLKRKFL